MEEMKSAARAQGLWNLWISPHLAACMTEAVSSSGEQHALLGAGLSNLVRHPRNPRCRTLQTLWSAQPTASIQAPRLRLVSTLAFLECCIDKVSSAWL